MLQDFLSTAWLWIEAVIIVCKRNANSTQLWYFFVCQKHLLSCRSMKMLESQINTKLYQCLKSINVGMKFSYKVYQKWIYMYITQMNQYVIFQLVSFSPPQEVNRMEQSYLGQTHLVLEEITHQRFRHSWRTPWPSKACSLSPSPEMEAGKKERGAKGGEEKRERVNTLFFFSSNNNNMRGRKSISQIQKTTILDNQPQPLLCDETTECSIQKKKENTWMARGLNLVSV